MTLHSHAFTEPRGPVPAVRAEIAAFAATLAPNDPLYWPALAAADGCEASLRELNELLDEDGCFGFAAHQCSTVGMGSAL